MVIKGEWSAKIAVGMIVALTGLITGCGSDEEPQPIAGSGSRPAQQFYDYRLIDSQDGVKQWVLESDVMQKFAGEDEVHLVEMTVTFYQEGEFFSTLVADSGRAHLNTKNLFAWGDVVVTTADGRRLETQELYYDNEREIIHNDVFDRLTRQDDVVTAIGLEATPDLSEIVLKQRVSGEISDEALEENERR